MRSIRHALATPEPENTADEATAHGARAPFLRAVARRGAGDTTHFPFTRSPILLAYLGATIYSFDRAPAAVVPYAELDHVVLTREFLNAPERYPRALRRT